VTVPDSTVRYFAESRHVYSRALLELVTYAREHDGDFTFGPLDLGALEGSGLAISGPDLAGVRKLLDGLPGLAEQT
jgi:hypothetical protein